MNKNDIHFVDFIRSLPPRLKKDPEMLALAQVISEELHTTIDLKKQNIIYARIDELDETLLDILAYDMHIDWYDESSPLEEKREVIKNSVKVHKRLGTKYAIETALNAIYPGTRVSEWFEYGGMPYRFRLHINLAMDDNDIERRKRTVDKVKYYKNLRSHLDGVEYSSTFPELSKKVYVTPHRCETRMISVLPELHPVTEHRCAVYATPYLGRAMAITRLPQLEPARGAVRGRLRFGAGAMTIMQTRLPMLKEPKNEEETS